MRVSKRAMSPGGSNRGRSDATGTTVQLPRLLRVEEVADLLRTSRKAVYCMIHRGEVPGVIRVNRRVLVDARALVSWLDQRLAASSNQETRP
jgi:excisionase family DNA binding protein